MVDVLRRWISVRVTANIRQGAPSLASPAARKVAPGASLLAYTLVTGDAVQGNASWYGLDDGTFIWAGACVAAAAPDCDLSTTPMVVDLDWYDTVTDFAAAKSAGVVGIIHKATTGTSGQTENYSERRDAAKAAGLLWGCYHWGTSKDVGLQLENFFRYANPSADELIALDFELTPGDQMTIQQARDFCQGVYNRSVPQRWPVLYSNNLLTDPGLGLGQTSDPFFAPIRLWLAAYIDTPVVQPSWSNYWLWQYTDGTNHTGSGICSRVPGIPGNISGGLDCNYFAGSAAELAAKWAG